MRFEQTVKVILQTFAVFVGFTLNEAIKSAIEKKGDYKDWHWYALLALIALLLRFIIGSTVHLNRTYVTPPATQPLAAGQATSTSVGMLFKDLLFLVAFGIAAIFMSKGKDVSEFAFWGMVYLFCAAIWCLVDWVLRDVIKWCGDTETTTRVGAFSPPWLGLCLGQLAFTAALYVVYVCVLPTMPATAVAITLAGGYIACLYIDLRIILR